eukprot:JP437593.1.p3 GENE.JP437593.1~~JP437593.1.p3  ORF type:complete len:71 (-),score=9.57 JP437593.1:235-447(-)
MSLCANPYLLCVFVACFTSGFVPFVLFELLCCFVLFVVCVVRAFCVGVCLWERGLVDIDVCLFAHACFVL